MPLFSSCALLMSLSAVIYIQEHHLCGRGITEVIYWLCLRLFEVPRDKAVWIFKSERTKLTDIVSVVSRECLVRKVLSSNYIWNSQASFKIMYLSKVYQVETLRTPLYGIGNRNELCIKDIQHIS